MRAPSFSPLSSLSPYSVSSYLSTLRDFPLAQALPGQGILHRHRVVLVTGGGGAAVVGANHRGTVLVHEKVVQGTLIQILLRRVQIVQILIV